METGENNFFVIEAKKFNDSLASNYHLSIEIGEKNFSYCLLNTITLTYEYFKSYEISSVEQPIDEISEIIIQDQLITSDFSSQSIAFIGLPTTLIPNEIYTKKEAKTLLDFNIDTDGEIKSDEVISQAAWLIYSLPKEIVSLIKDAFPNAKVKAQESILIDQYHTLNGDKEEAYIYLNKEKLGVTIFKNKQLIFNNTFDYFSKEDVLYFITTIFGDITTEDMTFKLLYEYIRNIKLGKRPHNFSFPNEFNNMPNHKHFGLFSQILCV